MINVELKERKVTIEIEEILKKTDEVIIFLDRKGRKQKLNILDLFPQLVDPFAPLEEYQKRWEEIGEGTKFTVILREEITRIHLIEC